ncbi:MAG: hypothetical protein EA421_06155 [Gemmatimonadales bacterium]|nr:MAG: hypothetical protein EA421_06155 [Gemmatimonadales bacterium]
MGPDDVAGQNPHLHQVLGRGDHSLRERPVPATPLLLSTRVPRVRWNLQARLYNPQNTRFPKERSLAPVDRTGRTR